MFQFLITAYGVTTDYSKYADWTTVQIQESVNVPTTLTVSLTPSDGGWVTPVQRAYVQIVSTLSGKSLFTGFISAEPNRVYLAALPGARWQGTPPQLFTYQITATSDEYLLNIKSVPFVPAFVNQTQGQILTNLANQLCPGFFDTSQIMPGDVVPYFAYTPTQNWCQIAKQFGDASRYRYKARDRMLFYQPYADAPLGLAYDETKGQGTFDPKGLNTTVLAVPIVNDATIIGDTEAGNNREDYFLGDGFTGNFPLLHKMFRGSSTLLLEEDWTEQQTTPNAQQWYWQDPGDNFNFAAGALNLVDTLAGAPIALGLSYLSMNNGIEIAGSTDFEVGEVTFNQFTQGILGGLYTGSEFLASQLLCGFNITSPGPIVPASGSYVAPDGTVIPNIGCAGIAIQGFFSASGGIPSGSGQGPIVNTQINHNYVLQMIVSAPKYTRYNQIYRTVEGEQYGGATTAVQGNVTWTIQDWNIAAATGYYYQPQITSYTLSNVTLPAFAVWALVNNQKMNVTITNTVVSYLPMGTLDALVGPSGINQPSGLILPMLPANSGTNYAGQPPGFIGTVQPWPGAIPAGDNQPGVSGNIYSGPLALGTQQQQLVIGNGLENQAAQITAGNEYDTLAFLEGINPSVPAAGTPVRFQSWESQVAVSRLQVSGSIAAEAALVGDDGIRAAIVNNLSPLPRTSEDCDAAAQAFLYDRVGTFYNGTYTCTSLFFNGITSDLQYYPTVGRFLNVNAPRRGIVQQVFLLTSNNMSILEAATEIIQFQFSFGADLHLQKVLNNFVDLQPPQVLAPSDTANPPNPRYTVNVDDSLLPDLSNVQIDMFNVGSPAFITTNTSGSLGHPMGTVTSIVPGYITINVYDEYYGAIEVRQIDNNWGRGNTPDLVGIFNGPSFQIPRWQYDQVFYLRPISGGLYNKPPVIAITGGINNQNIGPPFVTSRRSKVLRVMWPLRPLAPSFIGATAIQAPGVSGVLTNTFAIQLNYNGDNRNIYGLEVRAADNQTILLQRPVASYSDLYVDLSQTPFLWLPSPLNSDYSLYCYFFNQQWDYSDPTILDIESLEAFRAPYIWSPGATSPPFGATAAEAYWFQDNFAIQPSFIQNTNGTLVPTEVIYGTLPGNELTSQIGLGPPVIESAVVTSGGYMVAGTYEVAISQIDAQGLSTDLSNIVAFTVPSGIGGLGAVQLNLFAPLIGNGRVVMASPDHTAGWHVVTGFGGIPAGTQQVTLQVYYSTTPGAIDPEVYDMQVQYIQDWHAGILGAQIQAITPSGFTITSASGCFANNALNGRIVTVLAKYDGSKIPYLNLLVNGCTGTGNSNILSFQNCGPSTLGSGIAQGGTSNTITLASTASSIDGTYVGDVISLPGLLESGVCTAYSGSTKIATIQGTWAISNPTNGTGYTIYTIELLDLTTVLAIGDVITVRMQATLRSGLSFNITQAYPNQAGTLIQFVTTSPVTGLTAEDSLVVTGYTAPVTAFNGTFVVKQVIPGSPTSVIQVNCAIPSNLPNSMQTASANALAINGNSVTDALIANPYFSPSGFISSTEAGRMAWVIWGTDMGDIQPISTITNGGTTINISGQWQVHPDQTSIIIIVDSQWQPFLNTPAYTHQGGYPGIVNPVAVVPLQNLTGNTWAFRVIPTTQDGDATINQWVRMREAYLFGLQGIVSVSGNYTQQVTDGTILCNCAAISQPATVSLSGAMSASGNTCTISNGLNAVNGTYILIEDTTNGNEVVQILSGAASGAVVLNVNRGLLGTAAVAHSSGIVVLPGALTVQLQPAVNVPNQKLAISNVTNGTIVQNINYVEVLAGGADIFPGRALFRIVLVNNSYYIQFPSS